MRSGPIRSATPRPGDQDGLLWFNPAAFVPPPAREYGSAPVAPFRLPGRHQWDIALSKNVSLGGTGSLQFKVDLINAFNQTQFLDVNTACFGTTTCNGPRAVSVRSGARGRRARSSLASGWTGDPVGRNGDPFIVRSSPDV